MRCSLMDPARVTRTLCRPARRRRRSGFCCCLFVGKSNAQVNRARRCLCCACAAAWWLPVAPRAHRRSDIRQRCPIVVTRPKYRRARSIVMSVSVCPSAYISQKPRSKFTKVLRMLPDSVLLWRRCNTLFTSGFVCMTSCSPMMGHI